MELQTVLARESRVTVIDDDEEGCEQLMDILREFHFKPSTVTGSFQDRLGDLVAAIEAQEPSFVICDNRLQARQMAQFHGVAVVKELVARGRPAMLVTMYKSSDRLKLRRSRFEVPVIVDRHAFVPERLGDYYEVCRREIVADPVDERKPHRTLIRIDNIALAEQQIDIVIPGWRPDHAVPIPLDCVAEGLRELITCDTYLLGDVNILFFHNLNEIAPPPKMELA
jgi:CheY-like chemotaxis protein